MLNELANQLVAEISSQNKSLINKGVSMTAERPRKYYFEKNISKNVSHKAQYEASREDEHSLYPKLYEYLKNELDVVSMRIDEKKSTNKNGENANLWLHPDLVGLQDTSANWTNEVKECVIHHSYDKGLLWSFEVKKEISGNTLRKTFFQAVSNSSWANYSYLVAEEINNNIMDELRLLCQSYNIGVIKLDSENPNESQILIPCTKKEKLDWNMINRIARENSDFKDFIDKVDDFYKRNKGIDIRSWAWNMK